MLYCVAEDGDNDKLTFSWETSSGVFSTERDSTEWIPPNDKGVFLVTCKVSDDLGSSDARTIPIQVSPLTPVPVSGLEWTLTDNGLLDSLMIIRFISEIESLTKKKVKISKVDRKTFSNIDSIIKFLKK